VNESFQIIATLAAAHVALGLAFAPGDAVAASVLGDRGLVAALRRWPVEILRACLGLAVLGILRKLAADDVAVSLRLLCGAHLALLGCLTVRRAFADRTAAHDATPAGRLRAALVTPATFPAYLSLFVTTGAGSLTDTEQAVVALALPTLTLAWTVLVAIAAAPAGTTTPRPGTRRERLAAAVLALRLQPAPGRG
jgi:hypothetical protein